MTAVDNTKLEDEVQVNVVAQMKIQNRKTNFIVLNWVLKRKLISQKPEENDAVLPIVSEYVIAQFDGVFCERSRRSTGTPGNALILG